MSINDEARAFYSAATTANTDASQFHDDMVGGASSTDITATHSADNTVTNASETLIAANDNRKGLLIQNTHASENARIRLDGGVATTTSGMQLKAGATLSLMPPVLPKNAITAIREGAADTTIHVVEFT